MEDHALGGLRRPGTSARGGASAQLGRQVVHWARICLKTGELSQADVLLRVFHFAFDRLGGEG